MDLQKSFLDLDDLELLDVHVEDVTSESANQLSQTTSAAGKGPTTYAPGSGSGSGSSVWY